MDRISYTDQVKANLSKMASCRALPVLVFLRSANGCAAFTTSPVEIAECILFALPVQLMPVEIAEYFQKECSANPLDFAAWATVTLPDHFGPGPCWALVPHLEGHPLRFEVTL